MTSKILSDYTIIQPPDCLFRCHEQSAFGVMRNRGKMGDRLAMLRGAGSIAQAERNRI
jgi:hypothetical protein